MVHWALKTPHPQPRPSPLVGLGTVLCYASPAQGLFQHVSLFSNSPVSAETSVTRWVAMVARGEKQCGPSSVGSVALQLLLTTGPGANISRWSSPFAFPIGHTMHFNWQDDKNCMKSPIKLQGVAWIGPPGALSKLWTVLNKRSSSWVMPLCESSLDNLMFSLRSSSQRTKCHAQVSMSTEVCSKNL